MRLETLYIRKLSGCAAWQGSAQCSNMIEDWGRTEREREREREREKEKK